jgi:hypothetical protein
LSLIQAVLSHFIGTARFFAFSLIIEGTTEKVLQFLMPIMSIFYQNLGFNEKKCLFEHNREVQTIKNQLIDIVGHENIFLATF